MEYVYICPKCGATYSSRESAKVCGSCGVAAIASGISDPDWYAMSRADRESKKKDILASADPARAVEREKERQREQLRADMPQLKASFIAATTPAVDGYHVTEYLGVSSGNVVLGTGIFSELSAGLSDLFGAANAAMGEKLDKAKRLAIERLIENCILSGANAALGIDVEIMSLAGNMIVASATGTAVRIEPIQ